ncbi:MAG: insulinase family protein, partial [Chlamydiae bacterium]|nr:insulinase family protein [Chlamydiota bacterium]
FDFVLQIDGYSEKASYLLEEVLNQIKTFSMSESEFDTHKNSLTLDYENSQKELPFAQALNLFQGIVKPSEKTSLEKLKALKELTFEDFSSFQKELFKKCYINAFLTGNMNVKDAEKAWLEINSTLGEVPFDKEEHFQKMVISLSDKGPFSITKTTSCMGTGIVLAIDEGSFSFKTRAIQQILSSAIKEPFFTALRSEQKTSYIAASRDYEEQNKLFQLFFVQSNSHAPNDLLTRFEIFIDSFLQNFNKNIDETRFDKIKTALITKLKNPPKNLQEMSAMLNIFAFEKQEDFAFIEKRISALQELTYQEFISLAPTFLSKENKKRISVAYKGVLPKDKQFAYEEIEADKFLESCEYAK